MHWGVYATFSGEPGREAVLWAAVLRGGPGAVLSRQTAAELLGLADGRGEVIHLTVPGDRHPEPIRGVLVHRSGRAAAAAHPARLPPRTRVEDTVIDLTQSSACLDDACGWLSRAAGRRLTTAARLRAALDSRPRVRWRADLQIALADAALAAGAPLHPGRRASPRPAPGHAPGPDRERPAIPLPGQPVRGRRARHRTRRPGGAPDRGALGRHAPRQRARRGGLPDAPLQLGGRHRASVHRGPADRRGPPPARLTRQTAPLPPLLHGAQPPDAMIATVFPAKTAGNRS
jgi:hypothetical protein